MRWLASFETVKKESVTTNPQKRRHRTSLALSLLRLCILSFICGSAALPYRAGTNRILLDPDVRRAFHCRGTACRPLRVHCRRTTKRSAAEPQPNRGTAILAVSVTGGTPVPQRRGAPRRRPEVGHANGGGQARGQPLRRGRVARGVGGRLAAPWFRIHSAERRVGQALPLRLVIAFTSSNGARACLTRRWRRPIRLGN